MNHLKKIFPAVLWAILIFVLSIVSGNRLPKIQLDWIQPDKLAHAGVYFVFAGLLFYGLKPFFSERRKVFFGAILISSGFGIAMELVQFLFFPGRFFEILDIIANISGSIGSLIVINYFFNDRNGGDTSN